MSFWVSAAAAIVAAGATYANNQQVAHRQDRESAAQLRQQFNLQHQQDAQTQQLIQKTAQSSPDTAKSNLLGQFMQQMQQSQGNATRPLAQVGNVSGAYTQAANDAALGVSQYGANDAKLLSSIDAPNVQRMGEAANLSRFGTGLNEIKRQSAADQFLSQMRLQGIRPNPWLTAVSSVAGSYAKSGGGGGSSAAGGGSGTASSPGWWDSSGSTGWGGV